MTAPLRLVFRFMFDLSFYGLSVYGIKKFVRLVGLKFKDLGTQTQKKASVRRLSLNFHKFFVVSLSHVDSVAVHSNYFSYLRDSSTQKYCLLFML